MFFIRSQKNLRGPLDARNGPDIFSRPDNANDAAAAGNGAGAKDAMGAPRRGVTIFENKGGS